MYIWKRRENAKKREICGSGLLTWIVQSDRGSLHPDPYPRLIVEFYRGGSWFHRGVPSMEIDFSENGIPGVGFLNIARYKGGRLGVSDIPGRRIRSIAISMSRSSRDNYPADRKKISRQDEEFFKIPSEWIWQIDLDSN